VCDRQTKLYSKISINNISKMSDKESVTSIQRSLDILTLDEKDQTVMEFVISGDWSKVRELVTNYGTEGKLSQKLVSCICSVCPPQSVIIAIKRAQSRSFAQKDEKGRYPLHYLCYHGAPTYSIVFAAQCHIAALEQLDTYRKTPLEYLMTMPWQFCAQDKDQVIEELQRCHNLKCYDEKSKLPNQKALESWGHKVVLEENIKCFMVIFVEAARVENVDDWEGCCLSQVAEQIKDQCHDVADKIRNSGKDVHIDVYRLVENKFVIVAKTQSKKDVDEVYDMLCLLHLGDLTHDGIYLRLGCVWNGGVVGSNSLKDMVAEAEVLQDTVKDNLSKAATAVSMALNDLTGKSKVNVSGLAESNLKDYANRTLVADKSFE
jgi:hypothetical protein